MLKESEMLVLKSATDNWLYYKSKYEFEFSRVKQQQTVIGAFVNAHSELEADIEGLRGQLELNQRTNGEMQLLLTRVTKERDSFKKRAEEAESKLDDIEHARSLK
jgi:hypothetical protein